jgi:hypothetical protein
MRLGYDILLKVYVVSGRPFKARVVGFYRRKRPKVIDRRFAVQWGPMRVVCRFDEDEDTNRGKRNRDVTKIQMIELIDSLYN